MEGMRPRLSSSESEERFRQIFFAHLESDGYTETDCYRLLFKTPRHFHDAPPGAHGPELLSAFREVYQRQLALSWFFEGLNSKPRADRECLKAPANPPTLVVIPGIFGEFIEQVPFQSVVAGKDSRFYHAWHSGLESILDTTYALVERAERPCVLSEVIEIGSLDQGNRSFANVIILRASGGSLETLGTLSSNVDVFERRLTKTFEVIQDESDIYLVGYSRGFAVALDLVSQLHERSGGATTSQDVPKWFKRVKGVIGVGGVYYGAKYAEDVLIGASGATSDLLKLIVDTASRLKTVPEHADLAGKSSVSRDNAKVWADFIHHIAGNRRLRIAAGKTFLGMALEDAAARETRERVIGRDAPLPNPWGIFSLVNHFLLQTFHLDALLSGYNQNILAFKQLVEAVVAGVESLTPSSRDQWWRNHRLPEDIVLFSLTGIMPEAYLNDFASPLRGFQGFGTHTSDYNASLRATYYDTLSSENTLINDSQVSHFSSRYWEEMYPEHRYRHYYLGVLGTHHWGMALPFTIADRARVGTNAFPRSTMLKAVASFITSLNRGD